jgi:hypothetical protein
VADLDGTPSPEEGYGQGAGRLDEFGRDVHGEGADRLRPRVRLFPLPNGRQSALVREGPRLGDQAIEPDRALRWPRFRRGWSLRMAML